MGPEDLKQTICNLTPTDENVLVGFENSEDAAVFKINENEAIVQTLDFITPVVDDPFIYGKIAAANSLSDIFAMGAEVKTAMNIVGFDATNFPKEVLTEIMHGGNEKIKECGGVLMGGHTIQTPEMYYGLSVTGMIHPNAILKNNGGKVGDILILTKPIGLGILTTAIKNDKLDESGIKESIKIMETLNHKTSRLLSKYTVNACTDITGFGLLGHTLESTREDISYFIDSSIKFEKSKSKSFLKSPKAIVEVPEKFEILIQFILKHETISENKIKNEFKNISNNIIDECIENLKKMSVIK